jgi:hypothetical protein
MDGQDGHDGQDGQWTASHHERLNAGKFPRIICVDTKHVYRFSRYKKRKRKGHPGDEGTVTLCIEG